MDVAVLVLVVVVAAGLGALGAVLAGRSRRLEPRMRESFTALSEEALTRVLDRQAESSRADLDARRASVEALVAPLRTSLGEVRGQLQALEVSRQGAYSELRTTVRSLAESQERLRGETANLVTALRAPAVRGRWGELQLRRVVEMAGMVEHSDFVEQVTAESDEGRLRPDLVVRLPGGGSVVVDSKVPLRAYLDGAEAADEPARRLAMTAHGRQLRAHVDALSRKGYWQQFQPAPDLVILFVPGEPILAAALEAQPDLYEHAIAASVLLATPTSLIGLLKTIGFGWRQEALAANAQAVGDLGRELHDRLGTLVGKVDKVGRSLDTAVGAYNEAVGSLEGRVLVSARRFTELRVADDEVPAPRQVERAARHVRAVDSA